jgi:hypothetical protein
MRSRSWTAPAPVKSASKVRPSPARSAASIVAEASRTPPLATLDPARWGTGAERGWEELQMRRPYPRRAYQRDLEASAGRRSWARREEAPAVGAWRWRWG